jgi:hypothetical protein
LSVCLSVCVLPCADRQNGGRPVFRPQTSCRWAGWPGAPMLQVRYETSPPQGMRGFVPSTSPRWAGWPGATTLQVRSATACPKGPHPTDQQPPALSSTSQVASPGPANRDNPGFVGVQNRRAEGIGRFCTWHIAFEKRTGNETKPMEIWINRVDCMIMTSGQNAKDEMRETNPMGVWRDGVDCMIITLSRRGIGRPCETNPMGLWVDFVDLAAVAWSLIAIAGNVRNERNGNLSRDCDSKRYCRRIRVRLQEDTNSPSKSVSSPRASG